MANAARSAHNPPGAGADPPTAPPARHPPPELQAPPAPRSRARIAALMWALVAWAAAVLVMLLVQSHSSTGARTDGDRASEASVLQQRRQEQQDAARVP